MDFQAIERITNKVKEIKQAIARVDEAIKNLNQLDGKITDIKFEFSGESDGGFGQEAGEWVTKGITLDPNYCGVNKDFFNQIFKEVTLKQLTILKNNLNVQIINLEKDMRKLV
jgi:hypothetical protein